MAASRHDDLLERVGRASRSLCLGQAVVVLPDGGGPLRRAYRNELDHCVVMTGRTHAAQLAVFEGGDVALLFAEPCWPSSTTASRTHTPALFDANFRRQAARARMVVEAIKRSRPGLRSVV